MPPKTVFEHDAKFDQLLLRLKATQVELAARYRRYVPLLVKVSPDLSDDEIKSVAGKVLLHAVDGVVATNTTVSRAGLGEIPNAQEIGGLSGQPLFSLALRSVLLFNEHLQGRVPIIACGGIASTEQAERMFDAGASLIQVHTGFLYQGRSLVRTLARL